MSQGFRTVRDGSLEPFAWLRCEPEQRGDDRLNDSEIEYQRTRESEPVQQRCRNYMLQQDASRAGAKRQTEQIEGRQQVPRAKVHPKRVAMSKCRVLGPVGRMAGTPVVCGMARDRIVPMVSDTRMVSPRRASRMNEAKGRHGDEPDKSDEQ